ncbi:hypothetical protein FQN54_008540 [Arachnomyces sp. PD_36]|nr:hypothetical protein FQN54_008540 [Arachnomyces sp. PD_36]
MKWPCSIQACNSPALQYLHGMCEICNKHFCSEHVLSQLHACPTAEDIDSAIESEDPARLKALSSIRRSGGEAMIASLLARVNGDALKARVEALRGVGCSVNLPTPDKAYYNQTICGGSNYHATLVFEDGLTWLARFRLPNHGEPPVEERNFDRRSEYAIYNYLAQAHVPAPKVFGIADDNDPENPVGAGYILLEKIPGSPMEWQGASEPQKTNFRNQLADIYTKLAQHPLSKVGRLQPSPSDTAAYEVGPGFFAYNSDGKPTNLGPFNSSNEYYVALINHRLALIDSREIAATAPTDQYLVFKTLLDNLPEDDAGPFYVRHIDSRDANFLVDDEFNITGVIDWELATVGCKASAFQSPIFMYDLSELYDEGLSTPSADEKRFAAALREKGGDELAGLAAQKRFFRLDQCIETDPFNREDFLLLFAGWWKDVKGVETFDWDAWRKDALEKYGDGV